MLVMERVIIRYGLQSILQLIACPKEYDIFLCIKTTLNWRIFNWMSLLFYIAFDCPTTAGHRFSRFIKTLLNNSLLTALIVVDIFPIGPISRNRSTYIWAILSPQVKTCIRATLGDLAVQTSGPYLPVWKNVNIPLKRTEIREIEGRGSSCWEARFIGNYWALGKTKSSSIWYWSTLLTVLLLKWYALVTQSACTA